MVVLLFSCGKFEEIEIRDLRDFNFEGVVGNNAKFSADILVYNPNREKIKIKMIDMKVLVDNVYLGTMICEDEIVIPKKAESLVNIPCGLKIANIFSGASTLYRLANEDSIKVSLDGTVTAQVKMITKKVKITRSMMIEPPK